MNTLLIWLVGILLGLALLTRIPVVGELVKPLISLFFKGFEFFIQNIFWFIFGFGKQIWNDHIEVLRNLTHTESELDPTLSYRKERGK